MTIREFVKDALKKMRVQNDLRYAQFVKETDTGTQAEITTEFTQIRSDIEDLKNSKLIEISTTIDIGNSALNDVSTKIPSGYKLIAAQGNAYPYAFLVTRGTGVIAFNYTNLTVVTNASGVGIVLLVAKV